MEKFNDINEEFFLLNSVRLFFSGTAFSFPPPTGRLFNGDFLTAPLYKNWFVVNLEKLALLLAGNNYQIESL